MIGYYFYRHALLSLLYGVVWLKSWPRPAITITTRDKHNFRMRTGFKVVWPRRRKVLMKTNILMWMCSHPHL